MTAKDEAQKRYPITIGDVWSSNTMSAAEQLAFEAGATWKEEQLQQRIKELENEQKIYKAIKITFDEKLLIEELEEKRKTNTELFIHATKWKKRSCELESQQGKFAEWASGEGWRWDKHLEVWWMHKPLDGTYERKTTPELWAEFDKRGDNDGSNQQGK